MANFKLMGESLAEGIEVSVNTPRAIDSALVQKTLINLSSSFPKLELVLNTSDNVRVGKGNAKTLLELGKKNKYWR